MEWSAAFCTNAVIINPAEPYLPPLLDAMGVRYDLHNMDNHYLGTATVLGK